MIYLDNAATTFPKPPTVLTVAMRTVQERGGNPGRGGHALSRAADEEVHLCRKGIKEFFNAPRAENVVFTQNATMALNTCVKGLIRRGMKVITTDYEHNSVRRPLNYADGVRIIKAKTDFDNADATIEEFARLLKNGADMLVICHASNLCGKTIPLKEICGLAYKYGALVVADASQSAGILNIDVLADGIDYLCVLGHKGMYGPQGTGFIIVNNALLPRPLISDGTGSSSVSPFQPDFIPDMIESGTLNVPAIAGLRAGVTFIRSVGRERLHTRELNPIRRAYFGLADMKNVILYTPAPIKNDTAVLSFNIKTKVPLTLRGNLTTAEHACGQVTTAPPTCIKNAAVSSREQCA